MTERLTDGQETAPWAGSLLLTAQLRQLRQLTAPHPSPTSCTQPRPAPSTHYFTRVVPCSSMSCRHLSLSHLPLNFIFASCPHVSVLLPPPLGGKQLSAKMRPNPRLFLPFLKRRENQSVSVLIPPCCAGLKPGLKSTARSHMP